MTDTTPDIETAFVQLRQSLRGYLSRQLPDETTADDLLQELFVKALSARQSGRRIGNLGGWLYAAARTTLVDFYRSRGESMEAIDERLHPSDDQENPLRVHTELSACLEPFMQRLPPRYRDALVGSELNGRTLRSLAEKEGVSVSALKSRVSRGRGMLRQMLLDCCHVELHDGLVSDFQQKSGQGCGCR